MAPELPSRRPGRRPRRAARPATALPLSPVAPSRALLVGVDSGPPLTVDPTGYRPAGREPGWGPFLDRFLALNRDALHGLALEPKLEAQTDGDVRLRLQPGLRAGAVPLRSPITGEVAGGVVVAPRFGWGSVGRVLSRTGWRSAPQFLTMPLVPGSGREVPPWVMAGPVVQRLQQLLQHLRAGYRERYEFLQQPRGQIVWNDYATQSLARGRWHLLPCRFSQLETDLRLRQAIRWVLEHLQRSLVQAGGLDGLSAALIAEIQRLLPAVADCTARRPTNSEVNAFGHDLAASSDAWREGVQALGWIAEERGLGGGAVLDGLAWSLPLEKLWESYVEQHLAAEARSFGGVLRVGSRSETLVPLAWSSPRLRSLGHLVPDFVLRRRDALEVIDAKYKSHFAQLDESGWFQLLEETQQALRADIHQVLAYASTVGESPVVRSRLIYPVTADLFHRLRQRGQQRVTATLELSRQTLELSLEALAFGAN